MKYEDVKVIAERPFKLEPNFRLVQVESDDLRPDWIQCLVLHDLSQTTFYNTYFNPEFCTAEEALEMFEEEVTFLYQKWAEQEFLWYFGNVPRSYSTTINANPPTEEEIRLCTQPLEMGGYYKSNKLNSASALCRTLKSA